MSNPEFKRNLWLSFSESRLVAMPAILGLIFLATYASHAPDARAGEVRMIAISLFIFIVWLWGAGNASAAIIDEMRNRTWDQQRMSALEPWTMTWGKLFGATSYNWYGGIWCLSAFALTGMFAETQGLSLTVMTLCTVAILLHAAMIAVALYTSQFGTRPLQGATVGWLIVIGVTFKYFFDFGLDMSAPAAKFWWGMEFEHVLFWLLTSLLFAICFVFAAWRAMCTALQVPTLPWAWPAFACILTVYFSGQITGETGHPLSVLMLLGLLISVALTYLTLFSEPNTLLLWHKLRILQEKNEWRSWLEHLPVWTTTLVLSVVFATLSYLFTASPPLGNNASLPQPVHAFTLVLMLLRDACIVLFFAFSPNSKNAAGKTMVSLILLDLLLPYLASVADLSELFFFFMPIPTPMTSGHAAWNSTLVMASHAATALVLVNWRLRTAKLQ